tara:strand:- start:205 stop:657 length:453 start_codon:yes stop_codon:yes gene_type:complete
MTDIVDESEVVLLVDFVKDISADYCENTDDINSLIKTCNVRRTVKKILRRYHIHDINDALVDCEKYLELDNLESDKQKLNNYLDKTQGTLYNKAKYNLLKYPEKFFRRENYKITPDELYKIKMNKVNSGQQLTEIEQNFIETYLKNNLGE